MALVVKYASTIRRLSSLALVVFVGAAAVVGVQQYRQQRNSFIETQARGLQRQFAAIQSRLHMHLEEHDVQRQMMALRVSKLPSCVSPQQQAELQQFQAIRSAGLNDATLQLQRLSAAQWATFDLASFEAPRASVEPDGLALTSMQLYGQACGSDAMLLQVTRTLLGAGLARALWDNSGVTEFSLALLHKQTALLHANVNLNPQPEGRTSLSELPLSDPLLSTLRQTEQADKQHAPAYFYRTEGRAVALLQEPGFGLQVLYYSPVLATAYLPQFLRNNAGNIAWLLSLLLSLTLVRLFIGHLVAVSNEYYRASTFDFLTNLFNRRAAMQLLESELARASRSGRTLCVMQLDIDFFKKVNDQYGHDGGDEVLKLFARVLSGSLRQGDIAARIGGEEFLLVLPDTDLVGAQIVAERVLTQVRQARLDYHGTCIQITCSLGIAAWQGPQDDLQALLIRADELLYQAKQQGRDRAIAEQPSQSLNLAVAA
jgi:diguanylate cyclase (GGDEF)-like protein